MGRPERPTGWWRGCAATLAIALALPPALPVAAAQQPSATRMDYRIAPGPLATALQQWARQSGQTVLFDADEVTGLHSPGVDARLRPEQALQQLVDALPIGILQTSTGVFVVRRSAPVVAATPQPPVPSVAAPAAPAQLQLPAVHVTGSRLPRTSVQTTLPVTLIDRDEIRRSGYGSLFELLRHLPGMNGHAPLSTARSGDSLYLPVGAAATTSLDGMGPRATLFLVNGRRLPRYPMVSLQQGALTDLGGIPLSLVERIELVRGGASAIYGADAMSGVVNILLRDQADGPEATLQAGLSNRGDGGQQRLQLASGGARDAGDRWFAGLDVQRVQHVAGDRRDWHAEQQRYPIGLLTRGGLYLPAQRCAAPLQRDADGCWYDSARPRSLQPAATTAAAYARYQHARGQGRYAYADARASQTTQQFELGPTAAALRIGRDLLINHVFQEGGNVRSQVQASTFDIGAGIGRDQPGRSWEAGISAQRSAVQVSTDGAVRTERLYAAARDGFLPGFSALPPALAAPLFPTIHNRGRTDQWQAWWGLQRDLIALPGGPAQLASGIDLRHEAWTARPDRLLGDGALALGLPIQQRRLARPSGAVYGELGLPLTATLRADLAARWDRDGGDSAFSPRAGLRWNLSPQWSLLLSSGRGYRAPSLFERRRPPGYFEQVVLPATTTLPACSLRTTRGCLVDVQVAENTALKAETSRSHTLGVDWSPLDTLSFSLTHNVIELRNEILALRPEDALWNPGSWALDRGGRLQAVRLSFDNVGRTRSRNWVLRGDYHYDTRAHGQWRLSLDALKQQQLRRTRQHGQAVDLRGHATPALAGVFTTQWQNPRWDIALRANYVGRTRAWLPGDSCADTQREQGRCNNPAQLLWNLHLGRQLGPRVSVALDVHNLGDRQPVNYLAGNGGMAPGLDDPLGRYFLLTLQLR